jgi:hypothetical protein
MTANKDNKAANYRWQRIQPALIVGHTLTVKAKREQPMAVLFRQSELDGACALHCIASVLVILELAKSQALTFASSRQYGVPADLWREFHDVYFTGCDAPDLVVRLQRMQLPIKLTAKYNGSDDVDAFAMQSLASGYLVLLSFKSVLTRRTNHWALGVGSEGLQYRNQAVPDTLLLLDPSGEEPRYMAWNARLRMQPHKKPETLSQQAKPMNWLYESPEWPAELVRITSAIRIIRSDV